MLADVALGTHRRLHVVQDISDPVSGNVVVPRALLRTMLDCLDRAGRASAHAAQISSRAQSAFDEESKRLTDATSDTRRLLDRI